MHLRNDYEGVIHGLKTLGDAIVVVFLLPCLKYAFSICKSFFFNLLIILNFENTLKLLRAKIFSSE